MKTKILKTRKLLGLGIFLALFAIGVTSAWAAYDSSSESNACYGQNCRTWHNAGYTHSQYPHGIDFATFNGYKDATKAGRSYKEMQFTYIESDLAPQPGFPIPTPWESWSNYNFSGGTSHYIDFDQYEDNRTRVGFWGYIHNNGEANLHPANGSMIKLTGWNSATPRTSYNPKYTLWASNTKPRTVWSDVTLTGSEPFTMTPVEAYLSREDGVVAANASILQNLTHQGQSVRSNGNNPIGRIDSSELHYVLVYIEFEIVATPDEEEPPVCRSVEIIRPNEADDGKSGQLLPTPLPTITVDENGFINEPLEIRVDADPGSYTRFQYGSSQSNNGITFNNNGGEYYTTATSVTMNGVPGGTTGVGKETIWVAAVDENDVWVDTCMDLFQTKVESDEPLLCETLSTDPGHSGSQQVATNDLNEIEIVELTDTEGNPYVDENGDPALVQYCFTHDGDGDFFPAAYQIDDKCAVAPSSVELSYIAYEPTMVSIQVLGAPQGKCKDSFKTAALKGECLDLDINQSTFTEDDSTYSVSVDTDPSDLDYSVEWMVARPGGDGPEFYVVLDGDDIDLDDYSSDYDFRPGDTLHARAVNVNDPNDVCYDSLDSEEETCEEMTLDRNEFERGVDQEVCIDDYSWEFDELRWENSEGEDGYVNVDSDLCFTVDENMTEDATWIEFWVPDYGDACIDRLVYEIKPPDFDKNVRDQGGSRFINRAISNFTDEYAEYEILYEHYNEGTQDVEITDTIGREGRIQGYIDTGSGLQESGYIDYDEGSMEITVDGDRVDECDSNDDLDEDLCYEGSIGDNDGVTVYNVPDREEVRVYYRGIIHSEVNPTNCTDQNHPFNKTGICGEVYDNTSRFEDDTDNGSSAAELVIPCPYIIIRSGGDVFMENPFDYGVDTLSCAEIRNVDVPVIIPTPPLPPNLQKTGEDDTFVPTFDHRLCEDQSGESPEGYEGIDRLSSLICEVSLTVSEDLTSQAIVQNIKTNKERISRYEANLNSVPPVSDESLLPESRNNVYMKNNGDLVFGAGSDVAFTKGARTFIVEDHDVIIKNNIVYRDDALLTDPRNVASIAIIVINGSIIVEPGVTETSGVFFAQGGDASGSGQVCEGIAGASRCDKSIEDNGAYNTKQYVHYGSIYGDIEHLFKYRTFAGDPTKEEGAVVIRFDNRVFLNTPPILGELVDVSQQSF